MFSKVHKLSLLVGACSILVPIILWKRIPDTLPIHYNAAGEVDNWAGKESLILLFFVIALLMGVMSIAAFMLKTNMKSKYAQNAERSQAQTVYQAIVVMNLIMQLMFAYITVCCVTCRPLGKLFLPFFLIAIFAPIACALYKNKGKKEDEQQLETDEDGITYRTAVDWWLGLLLVGCEVFVIWGAIESKGDWSMILLAVGISALLIPMFNIKYVMYSEYLLVSVGGYGKERIRYRDMVDIKKTKNPLSSAALSINRVQIDYVKDGVHKMILISPKERTTFIKELEKRCERSKS